MNPKRDVKPFDIADYDIHKFNPQNRETQKKFYPYFKSRGIDLYTQYAFHRHFYLATKHREDGAAYTNLSFPLTLPKATERLWDLKNEDVHVWTGAAATKAKPQGAIQARGLWIASPARTSLTSAKHIYWFESAYDAMHITNFIRQKIRSCERRFFISTGGAPSQQQFKGTIKVTPHASHHLCFDHDRAGQVYAIPLCSHSCRLELLHLSVTNRQTDCTGQQRRLIHSMK